MEQSVRIFIEGFEDPALGFEDPLLGIIKTKNPELLQEKFFGNTAMAFVSFDGRAVVVNHEEQYYYEIGLQEVKPEVQEKLTEVFREGRKAELSYAKDGSELKIRC